MPPLYYGYNPPFIGGVQNIMSRQEDERLIKNDILQLILTLPGERVYRPTFGTPFRGIVFDTIDEATLQTIERDVQDAIETHEERVAVNEVKAELQDEGQSIHLKVNVSPNNLPLTQYLLELNFDETGLVRLTR